MEFITNNLAKFRYPGIILVVSFFLVAFKSEGNMQLQTDFKDSILSRSICIAENYSEISDAKDSVQHSILKIPSDAVFKYMSRRINEYKYRVVRLRISSEEVKLKSMRVSIIKEDDGYLVISGLNAGDSLLIAPQESLKELLKLYKLELRKAFSEG